MTPQEQRTLYERNIRLNGADYQLRKLQTECNELAAEIGKYFEGRATLDDVASELADVRITSDQAVLIIGIGAFEDWRVRKLRKLETQVVRKEHEVATP